jgi:hypothetical protein
VHCIFVDKLLAIYIIYFVAVSRCSQLLLLTAFRENAAGGCVCVKGLQCGSPLAMRTRDPPIIQVEIPTASLFTDMSYVLHIKNINDEKTSFAVLKSNLSLY